ncbi:hypothetical protein [Qipengyuania sp. ASV99]|uniref:hypothetical protein n=1 Tax=Qipengyuania sp. ASV99 TaxID=3399681 RepID=UPI003A4C669A
MRKSHMHLAAIAIVTVGFVAASPGASANPGALAAIAQTSPDLTAEQQAEFDGWTAEQQAAYRIWPAETQAYYWELSAQRQGLFWRLTDQDKVALTLMTGPERDTAWTRIEARASGNPETN